ncbi:unnamed protein product [Thlaspi arvense]|uniref:DUF4283 domain-containing protein n=1 Tax=Thlaspi arvense TaxID=13288 RepID=A0AAU9RCN3_THLAR|nr:unnamed protein product [Thlaspi arvense]
MLATSMAGDNSLWPPPDPPNPVPPPPSLTSYRCPLPLLSFQAPSEPWTLATTMPLTTESTQMVTDTTMATPTDLGITCETSTSLPSGPEDSTMYEAHDVVATDVPTFTDVVPGCASQPLSSPDLADPTHSGSDLVSNSGGTGNVNTWAAKLQQSVDRALEKTSSPALTPAGVPRIKIPDSVFKRGADLHHDFVLDIFMGKTPSFGCIQSVLTHIWGRGMKLQIHMRPDSKSMLVRIPNSSIKKKIVDQKIWHIGSSLFYVAQWSAEVAVKPPSFTSIPLWAHVKGVPFDLYTQEGLGQNVIPTGSAPSAQPPNKAASAPVDLVSPEVSPVDLTSEVPVNSLSGSSLSVGIGDPLQEASKPENLSPLGKGAVEICSDDIAAPPDVEKISHLIALPVHVSHRPVINRVFKKASPTGARFIRKPPRAKSSLSIEGINPFACLDTNGSIVLEGEAGDSSLSSEPPDNDHTPSGSAIAALPIPNGFTSPSVGSLLQMGEHQH